MNGLLIAAPASGSGKTTITLGILRALIRAGIDIRSAKSGPDYIDTRFHAAASNSECVNLDAWAMSDDRVSHLAHGSTPLIIEGAMGLFDGAPPNGKGACADLAQILGLPVVLVLDVSSQAQSVAAVVKGFASFRDDITVAGLILNKVGSPRHDAMLRAALLPLGIPVLGSVLRNPDLQIPSRHLGLVQAQEHDQLNNFLDNAASIIETSLDLDAFQAMLKTQTLPTGPHIRLEPPAQRISIASDAAFAFAYPHILSDWRAKGAEITPFSPLKDEAPATDADLVFLPGGYPELYAGTLASNSNYKQGVLAAKSVYGECGGYMAMGAGLIDKSGKRHQMLGLLDLETSFEHRKLHLGYRNLTATSGPFQGQYKGHEFHYSTELRANGPSLFDATDAAGSALPAMGINLGRYSGSYAHIIDAAT